MMILPFSIIYFCNKLLENSDTESSTDAIDKFHNIDAFFVRTSIKNQSFSNPNYYLGYDVF